jgi:hypothetical protein
LKRFIMELILVWTTAASVLGVTRPIAAHETGLASIHDWRREGGRICMSDHYHDGSGNGRTRHHAQLAAMHAWSDFTVFEYGSAWGHFGLAAGRKVRCTGGGQSWYCAVVARPCKRG